MPTRLLAEQGHDITVFYANSNIAPHAEYDKRLAELHRYAADRGFGVIEGAYDPAVWEEKVAPIGEAIKDFSPALGSKHVSDDTAPSPQSVAELLDDDRRRERCRACYRMRLEEAAKAAVASGEFTVPTSVEECPEFTLDD